MPKLNADLVSRNSPVINEKVKDPLSNYEYLMWIDAAGAQLGPGSRPSCGRDSNRYISELVVWPAFRSFLFKLFKILNLLIIDNDLKMSSHLNMYESLLSPQHLSFLHAEINLKDQKKKNKIVTERLLISNGLHPFEPFQLRCIIKMLERSFE